ncbi:MAG: uncharacterized protein QOJ09_2685, partial [Actinomycetota bacterium]|nr:uncharacterized protein [Actinomycetota bacterium]
SRNDARRLFLYAQGVLGAPDRRAGVPGVLRHLGAVQLDTISVLARSHELVPYARLGPVGRDAVASAYWERPFAAFEYWAHAACVLPMEDWPWCAFRRQRSWTYESWQQASSDQTFAEVRARLADAPEGLTASDLGGAKKGGPWWDWSDVKIVLERLLHSGEVVCVERRGWKRVYRLADGVVPAALLEKEPSDAECRAQLVAQAAAALGVATLRDLADYYRLAQRSMPAAIEATGLVPVAVQGWSQPAWADPAALAAGPPRGRHRTTLLSPFDSLVWERARTLRVFGFAHRLEAYVPAPKREYGYFTMPLLAGGRLVGRVDPKRVGKTLTARAWLDDERARPALDDALEEAAAWVGCDSVTLTLLRG